MQKLRAEGIQIARRTVAKYREELRIPSSSQRKQSFSGGTHGRRMHGSQCRGDSVAQGARRGARPPPRAASGRPRATSGSSSRTRSTGSAPRSSRSTARRRWKAQEETGDPRAAVALAFEKIDAQAMRDTRAAARPQAPRLVPVPAEGMARADAGGGRRRAGAPGARASCAAGRSAVKPMGVDEAALAMESSGQEVLVFRDASNEQVSRPLPAPRRRLRPDRARMLIGGEASRDRRRASRDGLVRSAAASSTRLPGSTREEVLADALACASRGRASSATPRSSSRACSSASGSAARASAAASRFRTASCADLDEVVVAVASTPQPDRFRRRRRDPGRADLPRGLAGRGAGRAPPGAGARSRGSCATPGVVDALRQRALGRRAARRPARRRGRAWR